MSCLVFSLLRMAQDKYPRNIEFVVGWEQEAGVISFKSH